MSSVASRVLDGPNIATINAYLANLMGNRREDNFVIWDLVHGVALSEIDILRNLSQRVRNDSMRDDFEGFSPLHVLALQGKIKTLGEVLRVRNKVKSAFAMYRPDRDCRLTDPFFVGNRTELHLLALGGYNKWFGEKVDEYEGSAKDIARIVGEKKGEPFCGKWIISATHIDALNLLKIWISCKPTNQFVEGVAVNRAQFRKLGVIKDDVLAVAKLPGGLGFAAYATRDIPANCVVGTYQGVFNPTAFSIFLEESHGYIHQQEAGRFEKEHVKGEYFSTMVDGETYCSEEAFINDRVPPSIMFMTELARNGLIAQTRCRTLRAIKKGEFIGTSYANHEMRMRKDYIETPDAIRERNALIVSLLEKQHPSKLFIYERCGINAIVATPQLLFRWLKSKEITLDQIEHILRLYIMLGLNETKDQFAKAFLSVIPKLKETGCLDIFLTNWIDPILEEKKLLTAMNQDFMFTGLAYACMELQANSWKHMLEHRISLDIKKLDAINFRCEISVSSVTKL